jgi:hypothetical protein
MPRFTDLLSGICGFDTQPALEGRACPRSLKGWKAVAVAHDRRLSAGVFVRKRRFSRGKNSGLFRIVVWRTYRDPRGKERASTFLHRDEVDPALALLAKCDDRMPSA